MCPGELVTWFLDLVVFDLARLDAEGYAVVASRVKDEFAGHLEQDWTSLPAKGAVRHVAHKLAKGSMISIVDAAQLYLATRGLKACIERFA